MSPELINKIENLVDEIISSPSKASARSAINQLENLHYAVNSNESLQTSRLFSTLISYSKEASGQVKEKQHWIKNTKDTLNQLKLKVSEDIKK